MDALSAAAFGIVLAACAGLRAFLPVLSASAAAQMLPLALPDYLAWLDRPETLVLFGAATLFEFLGDKVPILDHLLDSVQLLTKPALAAIAATPFLYQLSPEYSVAVGIIVGAPLALGVHATKASVRVGSSAATGGLGNPVLSLLEDLAAVTMVVVAFFLPVLALLFTAALVGLLVWLAFGVRRRLRARA